jgi:hypothetical protein
MTNNPFKKIKNFTFKEAIRLLKQLIHKKKEHIGDYEIEIDSYYKLLSSMYLKKNDLPNAALCLKKVFNSFIIHRNFLLLFF